MKKSGVSVADIVYTSSMRINNSIGDAVILNAVSNYGYNQEKLSEGVVLLEDSEHLVQSFDKEHGDVKAAYAQRDKQQENANVTYRKIWGIAKVALKNDTSAQITLQLSGRRAVRVGKWFLQTKSFYTNLLANTDWLNAMSKFGVSEEMVQAGFNEIKTVNELDEVIKREKGDAQNMTQKRDDKLEELYEWVSDYEEIAKIALMDQPQLLEKLGIIVKN